MKLCQNCNAENINEAVYCHKCGTELTSIPIDNPGKKKPRKIFIILGSIVAVLFTLCLICGVISLIESQSPEYQATLAAREEGTQAALSIEMTQVQTLEFANIASDTITDPFPVSTKSNVFSNTPTDITEIMRELTDTPIPTQSQTPTVTSTPTITNTVTFTPSPTITDTITLTPTPTNTITLTPTKTDIPVLDMSLLEFVSKYDNLTDIQKPDFEAQMVGQRVKWSGKVIDVNEDGDVIISISGTLLSSVTLEDISREQALLINKDSMITFSGSINQIIDLLGLHIYLSEVEIYF